MVSQSTRDRLIQASSALFMERGLAASGLKDIVEASAATVGSLYHFFPGGKDELAAETLRTSGAAYQAIVEAVFDAAPDVVTGVRDCFSGAAEVLRASDFADACPIATVALEVASTDENLRTVAAGVFAGWLDAATERLRAAGIERVRARELAIVLVAALEGGFLLSRVARDTDPMEAIGRSMAQLVASELSARGAGGQISTSS